MAWFPGAIRKEITRHRTGIIGPRRYTLHTAVSAGSSLYNYFNQRGNPTSHFYVRADGTVEQYVNTAYRAPAQLEGNHDTISVETQDMGGPFPAWSGSNVPAWTPQQVESLAKIGAWLHNTHRIKLQLCPSSLPRTEGFAYHRQGIDPWRVSGGEYWSSSRGKVCPGDRRVKQVPDVLARAKAIVRGDDMPLDANDLSKIKATVLDALTTDVEYVTPTLRNVAEARGWNKTMSLRAAVEYGLDRGQAIQDSVGVTHNLIKQAIAEAADDPAVPVELDAAQIEALAAAVASRVERVTVVVEPGDAPA